MSIPQKVSFSGRSPWLDRTDGVALRRGAENGWWFQIYIPRTQMGTPMFEGQPLFKTRPKLRASMPAVLGTLLKLAQRCLGPTWAWSSWMDLAWRDTTYLIQNRGPHVGRSGATGVTKPSSVCLLARHGWKWDAFNLLHGAHYSMWTCTHGGWNFPCREGEGLVRRPSLIMQVRPSKKRLHPRFSMIITVFQFEYHNRY